MNPPVEAFVEAIKTSKHEHYIILPNNKNIVMAAVQAKKILGDIIEVLPTVNVPQGLAALLAFKPEATLLENMDSMTEQLGKVKSVAITTAVRDSIQEGVRIKAGMFLGVIEGKVITAANTLKAVLLETGKNLLTTDNELVTLWYGAEVAQAEAQALAEELIEAFPGMEVQTYFGGQPLYHFIVSVE